MRKSYKQILEEQTPYLQGELVINASFLAHAIAERLILDADREDIENCRTCSEKVFKLVTILKRKSDDNFNKFCKILVDTQQNHVDHRLQSALEVYRQGRTITPDTEKNIDKELFKLVQNKRLPNQLRQELKRDCVLRADFNKVNEDKHNLQEKVVTLTKEVERLVGELKWSEERVHVALSENKRFTQLINELEQSKEEICEELKEYRESVDQFKAQVAKLQDENKRLKSSQQPSAGCQDNRSGVDLERQRMQLRKIQSDACLSGKMVLPHRAYREQSQWSQGAAEESPHSDRRRFSMSATTLHSHSGVFQSTGEKPNVDDDNVFESAAGEEERILALVKKIRPLVSQLRQELVQRAERVRGDSVCGQGLAKLKQEVSTLTWLGDQPNTTEDRAVSISSSNSTQSSNTQGESPESSSVDSQVSRCDSELDMAPNTASLTQNREVKVHQGKHSKPVLKKRKKTQQSHPSTRGGSNLKTIEKSNIEDLHKTLSRDQLGAKPAWTNRNSTDIATGNNSPRTASKMATHCLRRATYNKTTHIQTGTVTAMSQSVTLPTLDSNPQARRSTPAQVASAVIKLDRSCLRPQQQSINRC